MSGIPKNAERMVVSWSWLCLNAYHLFLFSGILGRSSLNNLIDQEVNSEVWECTDGQNANILADCAWTRRSIILFVCSYACGPLVQSIINVESILQPLALHSCLIELLIWLYQRSNSCVVFLSYQRPKTPCSSKMLACTYQMKHGVTWGCWVRWLHLISDYIR